MTQKPPKYGTITTRVEDGNNATVTRDGYHGSLPRTRKIWFEESKLVDGRPELLADVLEAMNEFLDGKVKELDLEFRSGDGKTRIVKRTLVE